MNKTFNKGDIVMVVPTSESYDGRYNGMFGMVVRTCDSISCKNGKVGVKIDNIHNEQSKYDCYWFKPDDIFLISGDKKSDNVKEDTMETNFEIKDVIFNDPATIVLWKDGTKTVVKCQEGDFYSEEMGLALCIAKKALGNKGNFNNVFRKWIPEEEDEPTGFDFVEAWRNFVKASLGIKSPSKEWRPDKDHDTFF